MASDDRGIHAILLYGANGVGKNELARLVTELWLCNQPTEDGADGTCRACLSFARGNSADLLTIVPTGPSQVIKRNAINPVQNDPENLLPLTTFFRTTPM